MSKAFTREDVDPPERSGRVRSASGLPPGATNYISVRGRQRLQQELAIAKAAGQTERMTELAQVLASVTVVDRPDKSSEEIGFGSTVTIEKPTGDIQTFTIAGVDELQFEPDAVSWVSPIGKALLAAEVGDRLIVGEENLGRIIKTEYRAG